MSAAPPSLLAVLLIAVASPGQANTVECGSNSFSFAEVVPPQRGRNPRPAIESIPDSLCADLIESRPQTLDSLQVTIDPRPWSGTGQGPGRQQGPD